MASTKIINVLKDDKFEEVLDLFNQATAREIIFILPKKSKIFSQENHFATLQAAANESNKSISLLCSNPETNDMARKYKFDVLLSEKTDKKPTLIRAVNQITDYGSINDDEDDVENPEVPLNEIGGTDEEGDRGFMISASNDDDKYEIVTASVRKNLDDIVQQSDDDIRNLKINRASGKSVSVGIKKSNSEKNFEKIKEVWDQDRSWDALERPRKNLSFNQLFRPNKNEGYLPSVSFRKNWSKTLKMTLYVGIGIIVVTLIGLLTIRGNASINIQPYSTAINQQMKIFASDKYSTIDKNTNHIPGQLISTEKSVSKTFEATGEKNVAQKARGIIEVFNNLSVAQPLVATTRFQNDTGLIFRTLKSINVPAGKSVAVEVIADKASANYNIAATIFVISSFKEKNDTEKLTKITGKSIAAMRGGISGKAKVVTEADYARAKETLSAELKIEIEKGLKDQSANLKVIAPAAVITKVPISTAQIDEAADTFTMTLNGAVKTIAFRESDLNDILGSNLEKSGDVVVFPDKLEKNYSSVNFDEVTSILGFTATVRGSIYAKVNSGGIINDIAGKSITDAKTYLEKLTTGKIIKSANVKLSLLWMQSLPTDKTKIKIDLTY